MKSNLKSNPIDQKFLAPDASACAAICAAALMLASPLQAQTIYRMVDPSGHVTFADKAAAASKSATPLSADGRSTLPSTVALPFELRLVVSKYPVTLYTSSGCTPCASGRALLAGRGIPFAEKTVSTNEDAEALQRISGGGSLPLLTIGGQQIKGFSESEWTQFLNAAGYPQTSQLPAGYRNADAGPLVNLQKPQPVSKAEELQIQRTPALPPPAADIPSNPAGIQF
jgi:glutaredoxin